MKLTVFEGLQGPRYRGYGDTTDSGAMSPLLQPEANGVMDTVIAVMRGSISMSQSLASAAAYASAVTEPGWLNALLTPIVAAGIEVVIGAPQNRRDAYLSALATMTALANKLDGPDRADVLAGRLSMKRWLDAALIVQQGIYGVLQDAAADMAPAADLWNAIQTAYQWVNDHKPDLPNPFDPWTWIKWGIPIALLGGIGLAIWFSPEIKLASSAARRIGSRVSKARRALTED